MPSVVFDSWKGGEYGSLGARQAGRSLPESFNAGNMIRYIDGRIGPRAGMRVVPVTGLPNGHVQGMGLCSRGVWVLIGDTVYDFDLAGGAATAYTMNDSVSDTFAYPGEAAGAFTITYLSVYGGNVYKIDHTARTVDKINNGGATDIPDGSRVIQFVGDRLLIGGTSSNPQRVYYSEGTADDGTPQWETFLEKHWFDVPGLVVTGFYVYRDGLLISSAAGTFTLLTGTVGAPSETIRTVTRQGSPSDPTKGCVLGTGEVAYMGQGRPWPELFNGALTTTFEWEQFAGAAFFDDSGASPYYRFLKLTNAEDWFALANFVSGADNRPTLLRFDNVFTRHTFDLDVSGYALLADVNLVLFAVDGDTGSAPGFYTWQLGLDRPAFESDTYVRPGDGVITPVVTYLHTPEQWAEDGTEVMVRSVIVDFRKWDTGSDSSNHFSFKVRTHDRWRLEGPLDSQSYEFEEAQVEATVDGVDHREQWGVGDQAWGGGFQILFEDIRGVAINSVTVLTQTRAASGARVTG